MLLVLREKPHDVEWTELMTIKMPLLLNYSQCKLLKEEYYAVIVHCTEVLQFEPSKLFTVIPGVTFSFFRAEKCYFSAASWFEKVFFHVLAVRKSTTFLYFRGEMKELLFRPLLTTAKKHHFLLFRISIFSHLVIVLLNL